MKKINLWVDKKEVIEILEGWRYSHHNPDNSCRCEVCDDFRYLKDKIENLICKNIK